MLCYALDNRFSVFGKIVILQGIFVSETEQRIVNWSVYISMNSEYMN